MRTDMAGVFGNVGGRIRLPRRLRWFFLPAGGLRKYTLRLGTLWFAPVMFLHHLSATADESPRELAFSAVQCLAFGLIAAAYSYPMMRSGMRLRSRMKSDRYERKTRF